MSFGAACGPCQTHNLKWNVYKSSANTSYMIADSEINCTSKRTCAVFMTIPKSGIMEQNQYVTSNLLRVYIRCGRL